MIKNGNVAKHSLVSLQCCIRSHLTAERISMPRRTPCHFVFNPALRASVYLLRYIMMGRLGQLAFLSNYVLYS